MRKINLQYGEFWITSDKRRMDVTVIHGFLTEIYWSKGISRALVEQGMANSLCIGAFFCGRQVGFTRAITDYTSFAYLCDVFVLPEFRKRGLAQAMVRSLVEHPELWKLRRWLLATKDAQELYRKLGFEEPKESRLFMQIHRPDVYERTLSSLPESYGGLPPRSPKPFSYRIAHKE